MTFGIISMEWKNLDTVAAVDQIKDSSYQRPAVIYKHSTRCSISSMALSRLERAWKPEEMQSVDIFFVDLIRHRDVSQAVAQTFQIEHASPQLLVIQNGECVYHTSHMGISYQDLKRQIAAEA